MNRVYLVTDTGVSARAGHTLPFVVEEACRAGVDRIQLREKDLSARAFVELGAALLRITRRYGAKLVINDRVDIALALDADGVHIGQDDIPYPMVRALLGRDKLIGLSINNLPELQQAESWDVDYYGVATIFPTGTKTDTAGLLGVEGLREICRQTNRPTFAIGGISAVNVREVMQTGVTGVAVVSAICGHPSPREAARELIELTQ